MPKFVSFMYFLLNSTTHIKANSLCTQVMNIFCKYHIFSDFLLNSTIDKEILYVLKSWRKSSLSHTNEMQDWGRNITALFSHCIKEKGTTWSINNEIRTLSCDQLFVPPPYLVKFEQPFKIRHHPNFRAVLWSVLKFCLKT